MLITQYNQDFCEKFANDKEEMSGEEKKFMEIMESSVQLKDGHYMIKLPFKNKNVNMPNNISVARQRDRSLRQKLRKDAIFHKEYSNFLSDMIIKGYAEEVPEHQLERAEGNVWHLPHHGVFHPQKGSLRVVFDCGAEFRGTSLNSELLQGPNLTRSLVGVLMRFRQEPIAVMVDVQAMFHQIKVDEQHLDFLRFLWWPEGKLGAGACAVLHECPSVWSSVLA